MIRDFSNQLVKHALSMKAMSVPPIARLSGGIRSNSGAAFRPPKPPTPSAKQPIKPLNNPSSTVPIASGSNMGTKVLPRPKTVPPTRGRSLVRS